jgi:hypothetical protein
MQHYKGFDFLKACSTKNDGFFGSRYFLSIAEAMAYHQLPKGAVYHHALSSISRQGAYIISRRLYYLPQ